MPRCPTDGIHSNFGDCFAYALARATGESLLYEGDDFARTDILAAALPPPGLIADDDR